MGRGNGDGWFPPSRACVRWRFDVNQAGAEALQAETRRGELPDRATGCERQGRLMNERELPFDEATGRRAWLFCSNNAGIAMRRVL